VGRQYRTLIVKPPNPQFPSYPNENDGNINPTKVCPVGAVQFVTIEVELKIKEAKTE
jgi:hypothetical protein